IAEVILEHKCNLEDSNMCRLADEFTLIVLLEGSGDDLLEKLTRDCKWLEREKNVSVYIRPLDFLQEPLPNGNSYSTIEVEGVDQAGIVYRVSRLLSDNKINIEELKSRKKYSPNSGTALYFMEIKAKIPDTVSLQDLDESFDNLGSELNVEITLK
ncbi:MAG: hypothetical protein GY729_09950, partial [Desulfobacteraceae bacterium]|nr:hypothetical protein [Desulfobacteraceae bacterium]